MNHGDAFNDMPVEYREYMDKLAGRDMDISNALFCIRHRMGRSAEPPPAEPEKPKAVASLRFEYEGGVWEHMAESIDIGCPPIEVPSDSQWAKYKAGPYLFFRFDGIKEYLPPVLMGDAGELRIVLLGGEKKYEGKGTVTSIEDGLGVDHHPSSIEFRMERDEEPAESIPATPLYLLIKAAEAVCDLSIPASEPGLNGAVCKLQIALEEYEMYDKATAVSEGPMHPDMIRAELKKAHNEGYAVVGSLKNEFRFSPKDKFIKTVEGAVDEFGVDTATGQEWVTIGSGYGKGLYIIELASVKRMES